MMAINKKWKRIGKVYCLVHFPSGLTMIANVGMTLLLSK
jgi:hypothetical protein